jgi:AraC-like DNA-binding protein
VDGVEVFGASFRRFHYARHSHETYAFGAIERGAMRFWHGGTEHVAAPGEIIALNPGEVHDGWPDTKLGCRYRMLYVERSTIDDLFGPEEPRVMRSCALRGPVLRDAQLARGISRFTREASDSLEEQSNFAQVLHQMFARYGLPPLALRAVALERECVARAKSHMIERLGEPLHLADIAGAVRLSTFYFLRTFKRATGMPPHAYLNQIRLERAREMLRAGEPPAQVAAATGFVDQSHLTRRFKGAFGVTPSQYRAAA